MIWIRCVAVLLIWSHAGGIGAQDLPLKSTGNLRFFVDLSAFRGPEGYTRQEVALLLDASQLELREQKRVSLLGRFLWSLWCWIRWIIEWLIGHGFSNLLYQSWMWGSGRRLRMLFFLI